MRIGMLLGGCGLYDGSDIHETVFLLLALESAGEKPVLLAPEIDQERTVDHLTGEEMPSERRNVRREAARLARGSIEPMERYRPEDLEALLLPGGYGPVVNLSTGFARLGERRRLRPEVERFIRHFLEERKPIGLVGLGEVPVRTILGQELEIAPPPHDPTRPVVDSARRIVHTPGFTVFTRLHDVRTGVEAMVHEILRLMTERAGEAARAGGPPETG